MAEKMSSSDDASEVAGELDDALNELGMLAAQDSKNRNRSDFIKDKWSAAGRRGYPLRYPLRREKEREISWCSGSSSSSSGSSSRRSSSSSGGSFCSSSSRSYSRSSLISSYSIAETPTGNPGLPFGCPSSTTTTSSSNSSLCSSIDLMDQPMSGVSTSNNFKSIDFPKVLRRVHHQSYKPYNLGKPLRRFSLQLGIHREERSFQSDNLNLRSGLLSDSEASSGSGTGTPPPPSHQCPHGHQHPPSHLSFQGCTLILDPVGFNLRLKSPSSFMFKETKSNPGSPTSSSSDQQFRCDFRTEFSSSNNTFSNQLLPSHEHEQQNSSSKNFVPGDVSGGQVAGMSTSSLGFRGPVPTDLNVTCCYGSGTSSTLMTRSKSLDDLNYALLLQDNNSSCSSDAFGFPANAPGSGGNQVLVSGDGSQYDVQRFSGSQDPSQQQLQQQQHQIQQQQQQQFRPFNLNIESSSNVSSSSSSFLPCGQQQQRVCSTSSTNLGPSSLGHRQQQQVYSSDQQQQQPSVVAVSAAQSNQLFQPNSSQVPVSSSSCDNLFESVVQRIGRLEM